MNKYLDNFRKYERLTDYDYDDFTDVIEAIDKVKVDSPEEKLGNAIIVMGFSGNGKTTYIKNFLEKNPSYKSISIDEVVKRYTKALNRKLSGMEQVKAFGIELRELLNCGEDIIIDGNFLNLFTRMALTDTLHEYGYNVNLLDITDNIKETLKNRKQDVINVRLRKNYPNGYTLDELIKTSNEVINEIENFYKQEKLSSFIDLQREYKVLDYGVDKYLDRSATNDEIISTENKTKH